MPANPKYLSTPKQRFGKVTAAILGGYLASMSILVTFGKIMTNKASFVSTSLYGSWLVWVGFMVCAFMFKKTWKVWALYLGVVILFAGISFFIK